MTLLRVAALAAVLGDISGKYLALQATTGGQRDTVLLVVAVATFLGSGITALVTTGMFVGKIRARVTGTEQALGEKASKEALDAMNSRLDDIHTDVREIRDALTRVRWPFGPKGKPESE